VSASRRIAAYVPDLMDRSRVAAAVPDAVFVASCADLATVEADVVLVDLGRPGVLDVLPALAARTRVVAFGSHVDTDVLDAARAAGCAEVLPRSKFFTRLPEYLAGP
jgi:DNA-binding NarL/FixJ family response regulator